ncbi:MAG: flagellar hook-associated protein [Paracoccaceae bacterium]|nr:MAG: flagellar hook-associated protein FlgK [Alphaproteobacteria bacterium]GIX15487.1 MAG: flagellar hook-associated protein [Paracoccaceae bacterium]
MSLSSALANAYSGLVATSRAADLASNNIANALTEGYARRELALSSTVLGGHGRGVAVEGTTRIVSPRAIADRRAAEAADGHAARLSEGLSRLTRVLGEPGADGALARRMDAFEQALQLARDTPESDSARAGLLAAAQDLARGFNAVSREIAAIRGEADAAIAREVDSLNDSLARIDELNRAIARRPAGSAERAALEDERARLVDTVNAIVPVRIAQRDQGAIALYTPGGAVLLDGRPAQIGFVPAAAVTADMTVGAGLATVTLDGDPVTVGLGEGKLDGGTLGAAFALRDVTGPEANRRIDALAAGLMQRLEAVDTDATGAGLFTDAGLPHDPAAQAGLAGRLAVNAAVDPAQGGALWRLRDGLAAPAEGLAGDDTLLSAMVDALAAPQPADPDTGLAGSHDMAGLVQGVSGLFQAEAARLEGDAAFRAGQLLAMREAELSVSAVDTDAELQRLLKIETNYAANARVIETVDFLWRRLMEI